VDKTTLYLPPELRRALADHARRVQRPQSEIIREAIATYVGAAPRPKMTFVGAGEDGQLSGASSESYLRERFGKT
jgi:predicted transcriptional regulator